MLPQFTPHDVERFWSKVDRSGECWLFRGCLAPNGYGKFSLMYTFISAHRFSFLLHYGYLPELVCHHCDVRNCVRPDHLLPGTPAINAADRNHKGRSARGERNANSMLTEANVREIRRRYREGGITQTQIANLYGVASSLISHIITRRAWRHVDD